MIRSRFLAALFAAATTISAASADVVRFDWQTFFSGPTRTADYVEDSALTTGGNIVVVGSHQPIGGVRLGSLLIYTPGAVTPTAQGYGPGGTTDATFTSVCPDKLGNFYATAKFSVDGVHDHLTLFKYTQAGVLLWSKIFASQIQSSAGARVQIDANNNPIMSYSQDPNMSGSTMVNTVGYDAAGNLVWWNATNWVSGNDNLLSFKTDTAGNSYVLVSYQLGSTASYGLVLKKISNTGVTVWQKPLNVYEASSFKGDIAFTSDGSPVVLSAHDIQLGGRLYVAKFFAATGIKQWENWNGTDPVSVDPSRILVDSHDEIYVTGTFIVPTSGPNNEILMVRKFTTGGTTAWTKQSNLSTQNIPIDAAFDAHGFLHVVSDIIPGTNLDQEATLVYDNLGNLVQTSGYWTGATTIARRILIDANTVYIIGASQSTTTNTSLDVFMRRISPL